MGAPTPPRAPRCLAARGEADHLIPAPLIRLIGDRPYEVAWVNEAGGVTVGIGSPVERYVKWVPAAQRATIDAEVERLGWARRYLRVPEVLDRGADANGSWVLTRAIRADNAVATRPTRDPVPVVRAIGAGLRTLHDSLPVEGCGFTWRSATRLESLDFSALDPSRLHAEHSTLSAREINEQLSHTPPEDLVVCHGDACAPNTLLSDDGSLAGFVDLGHLGVADRWADIAVGAWSVVWNFGEALEPTYYDGYGIEVDLVKVAYYRLLWDVVD